MPLKEPALFEQLNENEIQKLCLEVAAESIAHKRKVGAVITTADGKFICSGYNYNPDGGSCEDAEGNTLENTIHAEVAAINNLPEGELAADKVLYVTHQPCNGCRTAIKEARFAEVKIVPAFMKFDSGKPQYDLIPPSALRALADVLTYGAKKYKRDNWRKAEDLSQYRSALYRHLEAYRGGEFRDPETGMPHLAHAITNVAFLLELELEKEETNNAI